MTTTRVDNGNFIGSTRTLVGNRGIGVAAEDLPSSGTNGPSIPYSGMSFPADNGKKIRVQMLTQPSGVLTRYPDYSCTYLGATSSFDYRLWVNNVDAGTATKMLSMGSTGLTIGAGSQANTGSGIAEVQHHRIAVGAGSQGNSGGGVVGHQHHRIAVGSCNQVNIGTSVAIGIVRHVLAISGASQANRAPRIAIGGRPLLPTARNTYSGSSRIRTLSGSTLNGARFQMNFTPKRAIEVEVFSVDFANQLAAGETILSADWSNEVVDGADPDFGEMFQGVSAISGSISSQLIGAGVRGASYAPICVATTSAGQVLVLPEPGMGILLIKG